MAINKKLIHFKSKENFNNEVANDNILDTSIVFIKDSKEIYTHGNVYKSVNWSVLDSEYVVIEINGEDVTISASDPDGHQFPTECLYDATKMKSIKITPKDPTVIIDNTYYIGLLQAVESTKAAMILSFNELSAMGCVFNPDDNSIVFEVPNSDEAVGVSLGLCLVIQNGDEMKPIDTIQYITVK